MYAPPRTRSLPSLLALLRCVWRGDGDLLGLLPAAAYRMSIGPLGYSRRSTVIVNDPDLVLHVLKDPDQIFPKSDLMVGALEPLVGDSIFVSAGARWRRQREMIDPAFSHIRLNRAFTAMQAAVDAHETRLDGAAAERTPVSLDLAMSHLTADIITRTVFSTPLQSRIAHDVFADFAAFERHVAHVKLSRLIFDPAFHPVAQPPEVLAACARIRRHLGEMIDTHLADGGAYNDIASAVIGARDTQEGNGARFTREELIDQLGVFFLAGHETTASVLTWLFFILSIRPDIAARVRAEVQAVAGDGPVEIEHTKRLAYTRQLFRETLRLYPPITFLPRVAMADTSLGGRRIKRGALIMIAPWVIHRHHAHWDNPDVFDPDRFAPEREAEIRYGTYLPFGLGPRICIGAAFAQTESALILARLLRRFDFEALAPETVRPAARLTTRPADQVMMRITRRG
ncbi:cytochrome P450 [Stappia sp. ES.058]|uniref:cytochrome P450 n=1 Tax=Stappia sp. ES.058 TaxID=1881061 RepID=UPI001AD8D620|nr:cytochrome P450 [Stappia sp. ES.058]